MSKAKRIKDVFHWTPYHLRPSKFGGQRPPQQEEERMPLFWLARDGGELYFVNASNEILTFVGVENEQECALEEQSEQTSNKQSDYIYRGVLPQEAVKIDEFDGYYDLDFLMQAIIYIASSKFGNLRFNTRAQKGEVSECVLMWEDGDLGKKIGITTLSE